MRRQVSCVCLLVLAVALLAGCGGEDDLGGDYSVSVALRELPYHAPIVSPAP